MQATPLFLGTCVLASIAGAVGGAHLNTTPIQRASIGSHMIERPEIAFDASDVGHTAALPDQYAMTTPDGVVEVAELSNRGLYAQRRYGRREAIYEVAPEPVFGNELQPELEPAIDPAPIPADAEPALALAAPAELPVEPAASNGPRIINVSASLASR